MLAQRKYAITNVFLKCLYMQARITAYVALLPFFPHLISIALKFHSKTVMRTFWSYMKQTNKQTKQAS